MGETVHGLSFPALPILRGGSDISPVVSPPKPDSSASLIREADMKALPAPPLPALATQGAAPPAPEEESLYDLLGVAPTATTEQIRAAYLEQASFGPDGALTDPDRLESVTNDQVEQLERIWSDLQEMALAPRYGVGRESHRHRRQYGPELYLGQGGDFGVWGLGRREEECQTARKEWTEAKTEVNGDRVAKAGRHEVTYCVDGTTRYRSESTTVISHGHHSHHLHSHDPLRRLHHRSAPLVTAPELHHHRHHHSHRHHSPHRSHSLPALGPAYDHIHRGYPRPLAALPAPPPRHMSSRSPATPGGYVPGPSRYYDEAWAVMAGAESRGSLDRLLGQATAHGADGSPGRHSAQAVEDDDDDELTLRAVVVGLAIGVLLACTNSYFGLQTGWISMMSLQASLLGFAVFKVLPKSGLFDKRPLSIHENIVLQTTAVATGTLPLAAGFVGVIPALGMLSPELDGGAQPLFLSFRALLAWSFGVAFFGVFLAVPLRKQVVVREKLVFPSGTATAQVLGVLHGRPLVNAAQGSDKDRVRRRRRSAALFDASPAQGETDFRLHREDSVGQEDFGELRGEQESPEQKVVGRRAWQSLLVSFSVSATYTLLSLAMPVIYAVPVFDLFIRRAAHDWLWWFTPSFSYIGQGIIMGSETVLSMNAGMLCGWAFLSPLSKHFGWAPGPVSSSADGARGWILWPALAIMMAESILSVSFVAAQAIQPVLARTAERAKQGNLFVRAEREAFESDDEDDEVESLEGLQVGGARPVPRAEEDPSTRVVLVGAGLSCVSCVILVAAVFGNEGISWWATVIALFLASAFAVLGVRALGTTDLNPVSAIGKISQLLFAVVQPGNVVANLVAGGIAEAGAQQAGDLMQDMKTGYLWGSSPKAQFHGQLIGSFASVFVSTGVYCLYRRVYEFPSTAFPVPTAAIWLNLARLVNQGRLPPRTEEAMLVFGTAFVALAALKAVGKAKLAAAGEGGSGMLAEDEEGISRWKWTRWIPSGIAFAVGFINTPSFSLARLVGGLISLHYTRKRARSAPGTASSSSSSTGASHLEHFGLVLVASGFVLGEGLASIVGLGLKSAEAGGPATCWGCGVGGGGYCGGCP
ncbi:OPT super [Rhodotorula sphaerocarpa]